MEISLLDLKYAFLAGLVEGDGSIRIKVGKRDPKRYKFGKTYSVQLNVSVSDKRIADFLAENYEGHVRAYMPSSVRSKKLMYSWDVWGEKAVQKIKSMLPYLVGKREEALLAIQFQDLLERAFTSTPQNIAKRDIMVEKMHKLKGGGEV